MHNLWKQYFRTSGALTRFFLLLAAVALTVLWPRPAPAADMTALEGIAYFNDGEFKKAAAQFRRAVEIDPKDAQSHFWMARSYEKLADVAFPLDGRYRSKARVCLMRAMSLAPDRADYRRELFDFLLDGGGASPAAFRQAAEILRAVPESDPDYLYMRQRLAAVRNEKSALEEGLARLFLGAPRAMYGMADLSVSAVHRGDATGGASRAAESRSLR
jgi:tetratricopeptide (TPR) repeat protein